MKLEELLRDVEVTELRAPGELEIRDVAYDSRRVTPGAAFVAIRGFESDGHRYIPQAAEKGAACAAVKRPGFTHSQTSTSKMPAQKTNSCISFPHIPSNLPCSAARPPLCLPIVQPCRGRVKGFLSQIRENRAHFHNLDISNR